MKFKTNRFAFFPHLCDDCKRYVWMESYRKSSVWVMDRFIPKTLCKECLKRYLPKEKKNG